MVFSEVRVESSCPGLASSLATRVSLRCFSNAVVDRFEAVRGFLGVTSVSASGPVVAVRRPGGALDQPRDAVDRPDVRLPPVLEARTVPGGIVHRSSVQYRLMFLCGMIVSLDR